MINSPHVFQQAWDKKASFQALFFGLVNQSTANKNSRPDNSASFGALFGMGR